MAHLLREIHTILPIKDCTKVFVREVWVPFDGAIINSAIELLYDDNKAYQNLWNSPNYDEMLEVLTDNLV